MYSRYLRPALAVLASSNISRATDVRVFAWVDYDHVAQCNSALDTSYRAEASRQPCGQGLFCSRNIGKVSPKIIHFQMPIPADVHNPRWFRHASPTTVSNCALTRVHNMPDRAVKTIYVLESQQLARMPLGAAMLAGIDALKRPPSGLMKQTNEGKRLVTSNNTYPHKTPS